MTTLSTRRFLRTAALMDSANEHERSTAVRQASAMLREADLDWTTVLKAGLTQLGLGEPRAAQPFGSPTPSNDNSPFRDIFAEFFGNSVFNATAQPRRPAAQPQPEPKPKSTAETVAEALGEKPQRFKRRSPAATVHLSGSEVPAFVQGKIKIIEDRRTDRTPALIMAVCASGVEYGPLIAFAKLDDLRTWAAQNEVVQGRVAQPSEVYHLPRFTFTAVP